MAHFFSYTDEQRELAEELLQKMEECEALMNQLCDSGDELGIGHLDAYYRYTFSNSDNGANPYSCLADDLAKIAANDTEDWGATEDDEECAD